MSNKLALAIAVAALVLGGVAGFLIGSGGRTFGGQLYEMDKVQFLNGLFAGSSKQFQLDKDGDLTTSGNVDITSTSYTVNGITFTTVTQAIVAPTTTPCALPSPSATSTQVAAAMDVTTGTSTAGTVTIAKASTPYATTTVIGQGTIASGAQGTVLASTSPTGGMKDLIFSPSDYTVFGVAGATAAGHTYVGTCSATFRSVS